MKSATIVFLKEVRENLRDRRTVINTLVTGPLMAPLILVLMMQILVTRELDKAEKPLLLPVVGAEYAPNLIAALRQQNVEIKPAPADAERAVIEQDEDMVLRIPQSFAASWKKGESAQLEIIYDESQRDANGSVLRLRGLLGQYNRQTSALRLVVRGLSLAITQPLAIAERDQSTPQSRSSNLFSILPYFFIFGGFIGGMALAIDTTAGERERQSLEPLLTNPVPRWRILAGKLAATTAFSITTVLISILAVAVVGQFLPTEKIGVSLEIGTRFVACTMFVMAPLAALLATLQTLVAAFAKTYREAQTYISLLMLVPAIPTMLLTFAPVKAQMWMYTVPLMGQQIAIVRLLRGDHVPALAMGLSFLCTTLALAVLCVITARIYRSERLAISA